MKIFQFTVYDYFSLLFATTKTKSFIKIIFKVKTTI